MTTLKLRIIVIIGKGLVAVELLDINLNEHNYPSASN